ncbi:hypothetical protein COCVIDRAFT_112817, partial [Bipolaris victoriae FI3]
YTCTEIAERYRITIDQFFLLNSLDYPNCLSIQAGEGYRIAGNVMPRSANGSCKPESLVTCLGYSGGQCCHSKKLKFGRSSDYCQADTCASGLCAVNNPSDYSLNNQYGLSTGDKLCGGIWGSCCGKSNRCGSGSECCGTADCLFGNCTISMHTPSPGLPPPNWASCNTTNRRCGPSNDYQVCNMVYGKRCSGSGACVTGSECGTGCNPLNGACDTATVPTPPNPVDTSPDNSTVRYLEEENHWYGTCGEQDGYTCVGTSFGTCCSTTGYCGSIGNHCAQGWPVHNPLCSQYNDLRSGCQTSNVASLDGSYAVNKGFMSAGGLFSGQCCAASKCCGTTDDYWKTEWSVVEKLDANFC